MENDDPKANRQFAVSTRHEVEMSGRDKDMQANGVDARGRSTEHDQNDSNKQGDGVTQKRESGRERKERKREREGMAYSVGRRRFLSIVAVPVDSKTVSRTPFCSST